jgi:hypothetical protein
MPERATPKSTKSARLLRPQIVTTLQTLGNKLVFVTVANAGGTSGAVINRKGDCIVMNNERLLTLTEAAKSLPRLNGKRISTTTLWRWATSGMRGVKLETRRIGRRVVTSMEALERFTAALADLPPDTRPRFPKRREQAPRKRSERERAQALARAEAELDAAGIR